jgi:hypothetical protein
VNSVSPHGYFAYPEAFVPGAAMIVKAAFLIAGWGVSDQARRLKGRRSSRVAIRYSRWLPFLSWTFSHPRVCSVQRSCLEQVAEGAAGLSPGGGGGHRYYQALASPVRLCWRLVVAAVGAVGDHF